MVSFDTVYSKLNTSQRRAVDTTEGPVLVVAGPGTGKTQVLSARIANILRKTDEQPQNILALTFTESAAKNMRERVVSMIGKPGYYVEITTFHSFCTSVITSYPEFFPIDRDSKPITDVERFEAFKSVIRELPLDALKPINTPYFYLKDMARAISDLKREGVTPEQFLVQIVDLFSDANLPTKKTELQQFEKQKAKNEELALVYAAYQKKLREQLRYDFDDMITLVVQAFRQEEVLLLDYQEKYHYFLVDEYQDTNSAQNEVVSLLASFWGESANIFVVGDPHQSIYRFQGASTENVLGFVQQYPQASVITLETSYRCPVEVNTVSHGLISYNTLTQLDGLEGSAGKTLQKAMTQELQSAKNRPDGMQIWAGPSQTIELIHIAEKITALLKNGVPAEEIAILYRTNREAVEVSEILDKWEIAYEIDGGSNVFEFEPIRQFLQLLQIIQQYKSGEEDERFFEVLCYDWLGLDTLSVYRLSHVSGRERESIRHMLELGHAAVTEQYGDVITEAAYATVGTLLEKIKNWAVLDAQLTLPTWFETVLNESGFMEWAQRQPNFTEILQYTNTLFEQVKRFAQERANFKLPHLLDAVETMRSYGISLSVQDFNITQGAVHLSTVHKAKGQEWEHVFVIHCLDGVWGNTRERNMLSLPSGMLKHTDIIKKEKNEDDRRLLYVAITRAKEACYLSYPETLINQNRVKNVVASMFIQEIQESCPHIQVQRDETVVTKQEAYLTRLVAPRPQAQFDQRTEAFFKQVISEYKLSVSSLNNYLRDPLNFIMNDLLMIPRSKAPYLSFGTAMHAALETAFQQVIQGKREIAAPAVFEKFETVLRNEVLTREDLERRLIHGKKVLQDYLATVDLSAARPWRLEARFGQGLRKAVLDDILLAGRIDRFDWYDEDKKLLKVIDYKTGSAKSRNTLEGKTLAAELSEREQALPEGIRSPYKRQLLFYKLLTEVDPTFDHKVVEGIFEFVEPDKKTGKVARHAFDLPDSEVNELRDLIRTVMKELRELDFLKVLPSVTSIVEVQSTRSQQMK
jgi:DNA helicase-2/ATP-dependent DNA helicase PcrA